MNSKLSTSIDSQKNVITWNESLISIVTKVSNIVSSLYTIVSISKYVVITVL